jgi:hypothetical protein
VEFVGIAVKGAAGPARMITEISRQAHRLIKTVRRPVGDPSARRIGTEGKPLKSCCTTSPSDVVWCWQS